MCAVDLEEYCYSLAIDQEMEKNIYEIARGFFKVISECVNTFCYYRGGHGCRS